MNALSACPKGAASPWPVRRGNPKMNNPDRLLQKLCADFLLEVISISGFICVPIFVPKPIICKDQKDRDATSGGWERTTGKMSRQGRKKGVCMDAGDESATEAARF